MGYVRRENRMGRFVRLSAEVEELSHATGRMGLWQAEGIEVLLILGSHFHEVCNFMLVLSARCSVLSVQRQVCKQEPTSCYAGRHADVLPLASCGHRGMLAKCH